jgi:DNA-binding transcriptional MerR regulator
MVEEEPGSSSSPSRASQPAGPETPVQQDSLFPDPLFADVRPTDASVGYRGPTACAAAAITYRQLDYWARTGLVAPSVRSATGSGSQRLYSFKDILVLKVVKRLLDTGVSLQNIRLAVDTLRARGIDDLAQITLLSDGTTVYECTSSEEVVDLLRGGQGVFGIAVSGALRELVGSLAHLPSERTDGGAEDVTPAAAAKPDELSARRARRSATA